MASQHVIDYVCFFFSLFSPLACDFILSCLLPRSHKRTIACPQIMSIFKARKWSKEGALAISVPFLRKAKGKCQVLLGHWNTWSASRTQKAFAAACLRQVKAHTLRSAGCRHRFQLCFPVPHLPRGFSSPSYPAQSPWSTMHTCTTHLLPSSCLNHKTKAQP